MTDEERLELQRITVERVRESSARARAKTVCIGEKWTAKDWPARDRRDGRSLVAARWAVANGKTVSEAARRFAVTAAVVQKTFRRLFPDMPVLLSRRLVECEILARVWPEDEVTL